jgi:succinate dehydrogenase / fumarate reductase, cytochrome b subunit
MASALCTYLKSTIGRKMLMGLSGLAMSGFVLGHMAGNMLLFFGPEAFNKYGHAIVSNKILLYGAEGGLLLAVFIHMICGIWLTRDNRAARENRYAVDAGEQKAASLPSRTMIHSGVVIAVFIVLHLLHFKYGNHYDVTYDGVMMRDLHRTVTEVFQNPAYVIWYLAALVLLGMHLKHGFEACWQSLGFRHPVYSNLIAKLSWAYALAVSLGFISQPLYVFFSRG